MIKNSQLTPKALSSISPSTSSSSISSNTAKNEEEIGSKTAKERQGNSQTENDRQAPQKN